MDSGGMNSVQWSGLYGLRLSDRVHKYDVFMPDNDPQIEFFYNLLYPLFSTFYGDAYQAVKC